MESMSKEQWIAVGIALVVVAVFFAGSILFFAPSPATEIDFVDAGDDLEISGDVEDEVIDGESDGEVEGAMTEEVVTEEESDLAEE